MPQPLPARQGLGLFTLPYHSTPIIIGSSLANMYVERVLSFNSGWSILTTQKNEEWEEAQSALSFIDDDFLQLGITALGLTEQTSETERGDTDGSFLPYYIYNMYNSYLTSSFNWPNTLPSAKNSVKSHIQPKASKNRITVSTIEADAMQTEDFLTSLYVTIPYYYNSGLLDVSVVLIPTAVAINHLIELGAQPFHLDKFPTEETCRAQLAKFGSLTSQAPVVLAFFTPTASEEITVEEVTVLKAGGHTIERTLEFAPEYYQASVGLLSYFGEVLRQKDPNIKAKVRIEQDGNRVRLHIESPSGDIEIIEKELAQYALVLSHQATPESLFENKAHIMQLETRLEMARIELKQAYDLKQLTDGLNAQRITSLEKQVEFLGTQLAAQILQTGQFISLVSEQNSSHERTQASLLTHSQMLFKDLLHEASGNQRLVEAVSSLQHNLLSGIATIDIEDKLDLALSTIKETKPGFLGRILKELEGATYKASASSALSWVTTWIATHTQ